MERELNVKNRPGGVCDTMRLGLGPEADVVIIVGSCAHRGNAEERKHLNRLLLLNRQAHVPFLNTTSPLTVSFSSIFFRVVAVDIRPEFDPDRTMAALRYAIRGRKGNPLILKDISI